MTKVQYGNKIVFNNDNFCFDNRHIYIITGENGSGKSTLLNILSKYDVDYLGKYENENYKIGYLLQEDLLFRNLTVMENLSMQLKALNKECGKWKIPEVANKLGIFELLNRKVFELSGGEKKKVAIGQIILTDADIILLDEPTANIQKEHLNNLLDTIYSEFKNKILIIATHDNLFKHNDDRFVKIELNSR